MKTNIVHFLSCLAQFFLEWEMFQANMLEKIKTHILCSITFINCTVYEIIWESTVEPGRPQRIIGRMRIGYLRLQTFIIYSTYSFSTATKVAQTPAVLPYTCIACLVSVSLYAFYWYWRLSFVHYGHVVYNYFIYLPIPSCTSSVLHRVVLELPYFLNR
jgi:hypothetical protein